MELSYEQVASRFDYDPLSGLVTRKGWAAGKVVGCRRHDGYLVLRIDYKLYLLHRVCWLLYYGVWPVNVIDHIDMDPSNNKISNLRDVPRTVNIYNRLPEKRNKSGFAGVCFRADFGKWVARFGRAHLGSFDTIEEAVAARKTYVENKYNL